MKLDLHPRTLKANIWRACLQASDQEIHEGMSFYWGAHYLCLVFGKVFGMPAAQVAGVYAALSPMNSWLTNVSNVVDILRWLQNMGRPLPDVNTPKVNRRKAISIALGEEPLAVLGGRKVRAFYAGIADPEDVRPVPVDRHMLCLALGVKITDNAVLSRVAGSQAIYDKVERAYVELGQREGLGNRLASIAWFVQRRIATSGQRPMYASGSPVCCDRSMHSHGSARFKCAACGKSRLRSPAQATAITLPGSWPGTITPDPRGRLRIYLGRSLSSVEGWREVSIKKKGERVAAWVHPAANSGGWTWLPRYVVWRETGEPMHASEAAHHENGDLGGYDPALIRVVNPVYHGRLHATATLIYRLRDPAGRFAPSGETYKIPRFAAIMGQSATR